MSGGGVGGVGGGLEDGGGFGSDLVAEQVFKMISNFNSVGKIKKTSHFSRLSIQDFSKIRSY